MTEQEFAELAAGYALDALSPDDQRAFEVARALHPEWERMARADAATAAALADGVAPVPPPPGARDTILTRIRNEPQEPTAEAAREPALDTVTAQAISRRNWTRGLLGLAASLVLLVGLGFGAVTVSQLLNPPPAAVAALEQIEEAPDAQSASAPVADSGTATVHWSETVGKVVLVSEGLPAIADDESFELWYVREGVPISAGTFEDAGEATVLLDGAIEPGDTIAVTVETQGGSPTGQPTTDPIVAIPTA